MRNCATIGPDPSSVRTPLKLVAPQEPVTVAGRTMLVFSLWKMIASIGPIDCVCVCVCVCNIILVIDKSDTYHTLYKITSERGQPLYKGQNGRSFIQRLHCIYTLTGPMGDQVHCIQFLYIALCLPGSAHSSPLMVKYHLMQHCVQPATLMFP